MSSPQPFSAILFDLDGTLVDTAPDLAFALNSILEQQGLATLEYERIRPAASHGSAALLALAFGKHSEQATDPQLQQRFIEIYQHNITRKSALFDGMDEVLNRLEQRNIPWGVVTNKPAFLTEPLLDQLNLSQRSSCIVSADTTAHSKPHPEPMLYACTQIQIAAEQCLYIGDAERDIQAGTNANMQTVLARYGYLADSDDVDSWQADLSINHPRDILPWI